jgi:hypothetical protein
MRKRGGEGVVGDELESRESGCHRGPWRPIPLANGRIPTMHLALADHAVKAFDAVLRLEALESLSRGGRGEGGGWGQGEDVTGVSETHPSM